jgi:hypothetical protein
MEYTFKHTTTGKVSSFELKISEYDQFVTDHPELERWLESAPAVSFNGRYFGGLDAQTDNTFKEVLAKIGEHHPNTPLGNKYRKNKTNKQIKTRETVKKHALKLHKKLTDTK